MKQHLLKYTAGLSAFALLLAGCGETQKKQSSIPDTSSVPISSSTTASPSMVESAPSGTPSNVSKNHYDTEEPLQILIETDTQSIIFQLNDSPAAKDFYGQLPLSIWAENYGTKEKIFYPPDELRTADTPLADGPAGTLAYYAPWGNVALFYGDCGGADGLYELGQAVSGTEQIEALTGEIRIRSLQDGDFEENGNTLSSHLEQPSVLVQQEPADTNREERAEMKMNVQVDGHVFKATLEDNAAVEAFAEMMQESPVVIQMRDYSGFEKVGSLETSLPASDRQTTTQAGDIVLYTGNQIVMFYGSNSWSYTRLGKIDDLTGWEDALGSGDVTVTFSLS